LHGFVAAGVHYEVPDPDGFDVGPRAKDERKARLREVLPAVTSKMRWDYDFGDGWEHDVVVEAIEPRRTDVTYPLCVAGKRACPPDDCGGPWGYAELLDVLAHPNHPEHHERAEWVPDGFDPEFFDAAEATTAVQSDRPLSAW